MDPENDLEDCWADLKRQPLVEVIRTRGSDGLMALAAEQTIYDLTRQIQKRHTGAEITDPKVLADIVAMGVRMFMQKWREALADQNLTGLIEIVLEGQQLSPEELQGFVTALPMSILDRIATSVVGSATGTHALMSLEFLRRQAGGPTYLMGRENGRIWAEFNHPKTKEQVRFFLDEQFCLPDD